MSKNHLRTYSPGAYPARLSSVFALAGSVEPGGVDKGWTSFRPGKPSDSIDVPGTQVNASMPPEAFWACLYG
jgi:hypothetical protein